MASELTLLKKLEKNNQIILNFSAEIFHQIIIDHFYFLYSHLLYVL